MSFPYMRLYTGDWVRDTLHLSCAEQGIYIRLVMHAWDQQGPVPLDERRLCGIVNARSGDEIEALRRVLTEFWTHTPAGWFNKRVEAELEQGRTYSEAQRLAGLRSGEARRAKALAPPSTTVEPPLNDRSTTVERTLNPPTPSPSPSLSSTPRASSNSVLVEEPPETAPAKKASATRGSRLPTDWALPKAWGEWAMIEVPGMTAASVRTEAAKFADFWHAKAGANATKLDWQATWRLWCRNARTTITRPGPEPAMDTATRNAEARALLGFAPTHQGAKEIQ